MSGGEGGAALDELRDLIKSGGAAARYPAVRALVAGLGGADLVAAGRLLARLDPEEVRREHPGTAEVRIAITGHGTLSMLVAPLTAELARHGVLARTRVGDFDGYVFDLSDPAGGIRAGEADLTLCVLDPFVVFDEVPTPWGPQDVEKVLAEKLALIGGLAARFREQAAALLVADFETDFVAGLGAGFGADLAEKSRTVSDTADILPSCADVVASHRRPDPGRRSGTGSGPAGRRAGAASSHGTEASQQSERERHRWGVRWSPEMVLVDRVSQNQTRMRVLGYAGRDESGQIWSKWSPRRVIQNGMRHGSSFPPYEDNTRRYSHGPDTAVNEGS